jgi:hypothetical protein
LKIVLKNNFLLIKKIKTMKFKTTIVYLSVLLFSGLLKAQTPQGYTTGHLILADGSQINGWIKETFKKNAALQFKQPNGNSKQYHAAEINGVVIDGIVFTCINGDFFKVICDGKMSFLQKQSEAAGKTIYNGSEAIVLTGTAGKPGDYFLFKDKQLILLATKNWDAILLQNFTACPAAMEKAKSINGNIALLADAVKIYNQTQP